MKYLSMFLVFVFALSYLEAPGHAIVQDLEVVSEVAQEEVAENEEESEDTEKPKSLKPLSSKRKTWPSTKRFPESSSRLA